MQSTTAGWKIIIKKKGTKTIERDTEKEKKKKSQKCSACPKSVLLTAIKAIWNTLFLLVYSSESPTAPWQGHNLDLCCALSPKLCQNLPVSTCKPLLVCCGSVLNATPFLHCHWPQNCAAWAGDLWRSWTRILSPALAASSDPFHCCSSPAPSDGQQP